MSQPEARQEPKRAGCIRKALIDGATFIEDRSPEQLDGLACVFCGAPDREMVPCGWGPKGQLFRCDPPCAGPCEEPAP